MSHFVRIWEISRRPNHAPARQRRVNAHLGPFRIFRYRSRVAFHVSHIVAGTLPYPAAHRQEEIVNGGRLEGATARDLGVELMLVKTPMRRLAPLAPGRPAFAGAVLAAVLLCPAVGHPAEGGFSFYLPGLAGDIAFAQSTEPGDLQLANTLFVQNGHVGAAVLQGRVTADLDLTMVLDIVSASYTFEREVLGARYSIGGAIPFGHAELEATITIPGIGSRAADRGEFDIADIAIVPLELSWTFDDFSLQLGHAIYAPTGGYDVDEVVNLGLNHRALIRRSPRRT